MEADRAIKIPLFDGTNFSNWKYRVGILLDERGLKQYIEEDLANILAATEATKRDAAKKEEKKCVSILVQTMHDNQLEYVKDKSLAKDMFDTLKNIFERKSVASQLLLRKQLLTMKYNDNDDIIEHFLKFDTKIRQLKSTGTKMEDLDVVVHLLITLPKSYDNLVTALETMDQKNLSLEFVKSRLMDEFNKRKASSSNNSNTSKANENSAMQAKNPDIVCYRCGKPGHMKSRCRYKKGKSKNGNGSQNSSGSANAAAENRTETLLLCTIDEKALCSDGEMNHDTKIETYTSAHALNTKSEASSSKIKFVLDSGATEHMVNNESYFKHLDDIDDVNISVAKKNEMIVAKQQGDISIKMFHDGGSSVTMKNVLFVKELKCNLMSIRSLTKKGYSILFEGDYAYASINGKVKFIAHADRQLYEVVFHVEHDVFAGVAGEDNLNHVSQILWHFRLGHLNVFDMKKLVNQQMVDGIDKLNMNTDAKFCESCVMGKQAKKPYSKKKVARSTRVLELIHTDVCGPFSVTAYDGSRFFITFTDDYSRASMVYCIEHKSDALSKFKEYVAMAEAQHGCKVSRLRADRGGEYMSNEFFEFCKQKGIQTNHTVAYNSQMNGIAERLNRTLQEKALSMLTAGNMHRKFWNEAVCTANYIKNRCPTSAYGKQFIDKTPAEIWHKKKPDLSNMRIFGSVCYNHIPGNKRTKLQVKSTKCIMVGYYLNSSYRLWDTEQNKLIIGRNVIFDEKSVLSRAKFVEIFDSKVDEEQQTENTDTDDLDDTLVNILDSSAATEDFLDAEDTLSVNGANLDGSGNAQDIFHGVNLDDTGHAHDNFNDADLDGIGDDQDNFHGADLDGTGNAQRIPRRSERQKRQPERYGNPVAHFSLSAEEFVDNDPLSIAEAKQRTDWPEWKRAIEGEFASLIKNGTWTLCDLPAGRKTVTSKWVFKLKHKADGEIDKYKARLVARGFTQKFGFDYTETYSPVAKLVTLRILLAVAVQMDMHIHQMDVKCAFLNGDLNEDIFMQQPEGFENGNKVCKLNKAIYGLKQASRMWNEKFNSFMVRIGFKKSLADHCLYTKFDNNSICYVLLYVDDLLIVCNDVRMTNTIKGLFMQQFEMVDMGKASNFLGIHMARDEANGAISLNQSQYFKKVLQKFDMTNCKAAATPIENGLYIEKGDPDRCSKDPYRELIGCLTYATLTTRPDLCAATNYFSRFQSCYNEQHFAYAKRILRYIQGTVDLKLVYKKNENAETLIGYADADWAGDKEDRKSTSGYVFQLFGNTISWASRKQATVALSSTEAEYVALTECVCEAKWIMSLLDELDVKYKSPITLFEDNQSCIRVAEEPRDHKRMKHIDVKYNFIRMAIADGEVKLLYKQSSEQTADIMTKGLGRILFEKHRANLNLI